MTQQFGTGGRHRRKTQEPRYTSSTSPEERTWLGIALFITLVFAVTWSIAIAVLGFPDWFERTFGALSISSPIFYIAVWAPNVAAILLTLALQGRAALARLLGSLLRWRADKICWIVAIGFYPCIVAIAQLAGTIGGRPAESLTAWISVPTAMVSLAVLTLGPLGEELGWRGYLLPRLGEKLGPLLGALGVGLVWMVWHFPAFQVATLSQSDASYGAFFVSGIGISVVMAWIYNRSRGSVLIAGVIPHLTLNASGGVARLDWIEASLICLAAGVLAVVTRGRLGRQTIG